MAPASNDSPPQAAQDEGSPRSLFILLVLVGCAMFIFSGASALWIWHREVPADHVEVPVSPPPAFNGALLLTRIERLELELREAETAGVKRKGGEELKVLRIRAETASDPEDLHRVTDAIDAWEQRYAPR